MGKYLWIALGWLSVALGVIGAFLPLLPTTPFLLLAAYSFGQGSERLHNWIINHDRFGPPISQWQEHKAIGRRVKIYATLSMAVVFVISLIVGVVWWALTLQALILCGVAGFIWTRPEPPGDADPTAPPPRR